MSARIRSMLMGLMPILSFEPTLDDRHEEVNGAQADDGKGQNAESGENAK